MSDLIGPLTCRAIALLSPYGSQSNSLSSGKGKEAYPRIQGAQGSLRFTMAPRVPPDKPAFS
jgi:hypothetical protein